MELNLIGSRPACADDSQEDTTADDSLACIVAVTTLKLRCTTLEITLRDLTIDAIAMDRRLLALAKEPFENEKGSVARALKLLS